MIHRNLFAVYKKSTYLKPNLKKSNKIFRIVSLVIASFLIILAAACQPTPEDEVVAQKGDGALEEGIKQTAAPTEQLEQLEPMIEEWMYEKDYNSGLSLRVDAKFLKNISGLPVISIQEKPFESGQQLENIVKVFFPDSIVSQKGIFTKSELEEQIVFYQKALYDIENGLGDKNVGYGIIGIVDQNTLESMSNEDILRHNIKILEEQYETAPESLDETDYILRNVGGSFQSNLLIEENGHRVYINFVNWEGDYSGSEFLLDDSNYISDASEGNSVIYNYVLPTLLSDDDKFIEEKVLMDKCVLDMGIDYMTLSSVSKGELGYSFYYTRTINGIQEVYTNTFLSELVEQTDGNDVFIDLWRPEYICIETQNSEIVKVEWKNPTEVTKIDNENVYIKPWEEIQEIFLKQMDYMLSTNITALNANKGISINRIELGLTKVIVKDSMNEYKLIPTWCFMGDEIKEGESEVISSEVCFLTINAIDGTVVNRSLMY